MSPRRCNQLCGAVLVLGLLQLAGTVLGSRPLRGIGAASGASPLPKVFTAHAGYETFATEFHLAWERDGTRHRVSITPELYQQLGGPYNRRNIYGAVLSYGPVLPRRIWEPVFRHGVGPTGVFRTELGVPADATDVRVEIRSLTAGRDERWTLRPDAP